MPKNKCYWALVWNDSGKIVKYSNGTCIYATRQQARDDMEAWSNQVKVVKCQVKILK